ncbi:MAG: tetratricopeptide repeat protein [Opitutaceae bacterium]|nr:tetratricopeptide repeat protein [Opitutaceae bacterium]
MQISQESYRTRWFVLVAIWSVAAFTLFQQATLVREYLTIVGQLGLRGAPASPTPLKQAFPAFAADAEVWVRHAIALLEGDDVRLRYTTIDNAPQGREVHWNSAWAWTIAGAGKVHHLFTGQPIANSVEQAAIWLNPVVLLGLIIALSTWATRRAGVIAGVFVAAAMLCNDRLFEGFFPSYVDHHGLLSVSVLAMVLGAVMMGGGWWQATTGARSALLPDSPEASRAAARMSGLAGAFGLWVSAASVIPPIAIVGIAGLGAVLLHGRHAQAQGATFDGDTWRTWGRVGGIASVIFYLLEYFPNHLSLRMEPNHPFHALAWWGGAELIAQFGERWLGARPRFWAEPRRLITPLLAVCVAPLTIVIGGARVFSPVLDTFMVRLHNDYIQEFLPLWKTLRVFDGKMAFQILVVDSLPLLAALATLTYRRRQSPMVLWFATLAALLLNVMAWGQSRWLLNAAGAQMCVSLVVLACWTVSYRPMVRWIAALAFVSAIFLPSAVMRNVNSAADVKARRVSPADAKGSLARDIAATLRATQPTGDIVMLSSPNASTQIGYYGRFKTLGTLYWENSAGLKAAAAIFSARSEVEAAELIKKHQVTHIALLGEENFIAQYFQLLHPKATAEEIKQGFGYRLLADKVVPQWLQMIPYRVPEDLETLKPLVMLFKVNFTQNLAEALYNVALSQIANDALDDADRTLDVLTSQAPHLHQPWLRKGELQMTRLNWPVAFEHMMKGIAAAPENERIGLCIATAGTFYNRGQHAWAIRLYRHALTLRRTPEVLAYLSWILGSSWHDNLRDGKEALELAQEALRADANSPTALNALAAALAETGRFQEAIEAAERATVNARLRGETAAAQIFEQRLQHLRGGKPLRN